MKGSKILQSLGIAAQSTTREIYNNPLFFPYGITIFPYHYMCLMLKRRRELPNPPCFFCKKLSWKICAREKSSDKKPQHREGFTIP